jgi:hypothetical protein
MFHFMRKHVFVKRGSRRIREYIHVYLTRKMRSDHALKDACFFTFFSKKVIYRGFELIKSGKKYHTYK